MEKTITAQDQVFWYLKRPETKPLRENITVDVVIIGGGMAGLTAAQAFAKKGKKVALMEAFFCGAGATGKSSGFITPNSELGFDDFVQQFGLENARTIWQSIASGVEHIRTNVEQYDLECDYSKQDTLVVANSAHGLKELLKEHEILTRYGYASDYITQEKVPEMLGSHNYYGGITYNNTFGINAYAYCQAMKEVLIQEGVMIYEETPVLDFSAHRVNTLHGYVDAKHIIVCTDRFTPTFKKLAQEVYHAQTFILMSQPLTDVETKSIFPQRNFMVWDTELIYNYYRLMGNRLLLGGGSILNTYNQYETHASGYMYRKLTNYWKRMFPQVTIQFEQMWPGLIGISKDVAPLCGADKDEPSIYYIAAATGLPIAAMLGNYCADHIVDGADHLKDFFSPYRSFPINRALHTLMGTKLSFALSNFIKLKVP